MPLQQSDSTSPTNTSVLIVSFRCESTERLPGEYYVVCSRHVVPCDLCLREGRVRCRQNSFRTSCAQRRAICFLLPATVTKQTSAFPELAASLRHPVPQPVHSCNRKYYRSFGRIRSRITSQQIPQKSLLYLYSNGQGFRRSISVRS
jgi:hypothetical protein